jgi:MscS family membrane protein
MKKFLAIFLFLSVTLWSNDIKYTSFVATQIDLINQMNDNNVTQDEIKSLLQKQSLLYEKALNRMMSNKTDFIQNLDLYESEMFSIKKIIAINKRAGNEYAVLRDEVKLKIYEVLKNKKIMLKKILQSLDVDSLAEYETLLNQHVKENQNKIEEIYKEDYHSYLEIDSKSKTLEDAQQNIRDFYALYDMSKDIVSYIYKLEKKMYSLNNYSKYHLISFVVYVNSFATVQTVDHILYEYGLSVMKLIIITFIIIAVYFFRKIVYVLLENYILRIDLLKKYSEQILKVERRPIELLILIINLNMILYVYNSFSTYEELSRAFDIIYVSIFTFMLYKGVNTVATIKLCDVSNSDEKMKNDLINVGIKVLNFIIFIIGLLFVLYFAGVNLTAVLSGLGIGGFAVAFAAKDTISNFFGTVSILVSDIFSQGDWVEVNDKEGVVVEIGLRVTTLRTFDNALIAIPNGTFANADVKNWNKRSLGRRIKMDIGIKYDSKPEDIKNAVQDIREMLAEHPGIATKGTEHEYRSANMAKLVSKDDLEGVKKTLLVYLDSFASSSINIMIYCFSKSVVWSEWLETKEDVMHKIMEILEKNNLEFAFPSLSVYNEKMDIER